MNNINNLTPVDFNPFQDARKIEKVTYTTEAQKEIWLACAIGEQEANLSYNESVSLILEGDFRRDAFESALRQLVRRHEALRATVSSSGEHLVIYEDIPYEAEFYDFSETEDDEKQPAFKAFLTQQMHIPFNIDEGPLFRFFIHKFSPRHHYFTLLKHHIIGDGWSTGILLEDISKFYNGFVHDLNPILPVPYQISEYAKDELRYQQTSAYKSAEQYWINLYSGDIPILDLPTDYPRKSPRSFKGNRIDFELSRELVQRVRQVGAKAGCSLVNTLVAAFELFLHKTTNQRDITVGLPTAGQLATERFDLVGHCVNLLPLRSKIDTTATINEYLKSRRQSFFDAYDNQRFTFGELVKKLKIPRDESRIPLIPVMFNVDMGMDNAVSFEALKHTLISNPREFEAFELFLNATNAKDRLILEWSYNSGLFTPKTIRSMMAAFEHLLTQVADDPDGTIEALRLTDGVVPKSIVTGEQLDYDKSSNFTKLIAQSAHENAERTAVIFENRRINYRQLESQTNQFAHYLSSIGVKKGTVVGVAMDRSIEMLVALVGIAKSGGVYLPLDPEYPEERIEFMLQDSTAKYLVTDKHHKGRWGSEVSMIIFDDIRTNLDIQQTTPPSIPITGEDLVYLLYTSGSSGKPKGVQIKHSNLLNFLLSMQRQPGIQREDVVFNITTISFDIAGLELYLPLTVGATLVLSDQETARDGHAILHALSDRQVTLMQATPSTWRMMLDAGWEHQTPLKALCGGEPFPIELADKLLDRCQSVWNMYGPTETTIWSTIKEITRADNGLITVGHPIANTTVYILNEHGMPVAIGGVGEIFIAGNGVAKGYLNRPELNKERFVADPAHERGAMYATGDLGKIISNGEIQCLGRKDDQVKIRGHRIELGEIEYQLSTLRGIKEAIVDAKPTPQGDTQLVAYVIADRDDKSDDSDSVSWKDRWDTIYDTGVEFNKSANLSEHEIDGSIHRQLEDSEELKYQAEEWLKESVNRIRKIGAERIVEVGSGAGQILFEIAPSTSYYLATDYAHTAIEKLSEQLAAHPDKWGHVEAKTAPADDFSGIPEVSLDLVLVNSVAQYFPDANYFLNVIENAAKVVKPGGCIFIGDMQGKNSLEMCHAIDQFRRSSDGMSLSRFKEVVKNRVRIEEELVADPGFFYLLPILIPAITAVDIQLRKGLLLNETTNYHYDVWLYINSTHEIITPDINYTWNDLETEDRIHQVLSTSSGKAISITDIPNKRTAKDFLLSTMLQHPDADKKTIGGIKPQLEAESTGFLPDAFWTIGEKHGYDTSIRWSTDGTDGCFEAIFLPSTMKNAIPAKPAALDTLNKKVADFIRQPKVSDALKVSTEVTKLWKNELGNVLPDYMIPAHFVIVQQFPLTPNKKVDRKALPAIDWQQQTHGENPPKSEMEKLVASIWEDCLGITDIGLDDIFFDIGGHSLIAVKMITLLEKKTGLRLPLTTIFRHPKLIDFVSLIVSKTANTSDAEILNSDFSNTPLSGASDIVVAMTPSQREIWLSCMIGGDDANLAYNQSFSIKLEGRFDKAAFHQTIEHVVSRHEALRVSIDENGEQLIISETIFSPIVFEDLTFLDTQDEKDTRIKRDIQQALATPFNLDSGPLFKVLLHSCAIDVNYFTLIIHHIVCDATSMKVLLSDIRTYYNAFVSGNKPLMPPPSQLSDYVEAYTKFMNSKDYEAVQRFWLSQYQHDIPNFDLHTDFARPIERTYKGDHQTFSLNREYYSMLKGISKQAGMSIGATLTALVEIFLYHRTGQKDITLGLTSAGQYLTNHADMVGHCVNLLPLRSAIIPDQTLTAYLALRKNYIYDVYEHQQLTFSELLKELKIKRDRSRVPLVPFVLAIQMATEETAYFEGLRSQFIANPRASHTFEILLNLTVDNSACALNCYWAYNAQLFKGDTIKQMMDELKLIIRTADDTPHVLIKNSLPLPNPFPEYVGYPSEYPKDITLLDLFANNAKRHPDRVAVQFSNRHLTYKTLDEKSTQLANYLNAKAPDAALIPICIQPSSEMIIGILGVLKSGKAYVPIDPEFPVQRVSHIVGECAAPVIISDKTSAPQLRSVNTDHQTICLLDNPDAACWTADLLTHVYTPPKPADNAYVIYTSGSTGVPKGVVINHRSLVDYFAGLQRHVPVWNTCQSYALGSSFATDLGNTVLFGALITGSALHVFRKEQFNDAIYIKDYFERNQIDCLKIVPSHWKYLSEASGGLFPTKLLVFGGELLPGDFVKTITENAPDCTIVNHYGPTETTIGKLLHVVDKHRDYGVSVPIGKPFSNTTALVLNADMKFCPIGIPGELYIGGDGLATGYYNNPTLTNGVFIPNPIETSDHPIIYKTGDVVRWNTDGEIEYIGRNDDQVKIRGNRIELSEVQNAVSSLSEVSEAVVVVATRSDKEKRLIAYVISTPGFDSANAIAALKSTLPDYMIPRAWMEMEEFPRLLNGKIDKKSLPSFLEHPKQEETIIEGPTTATGRLIAEIWKKTLGIDQINTNDDFFELGGHSLIAVKVAALVAKDMNVFVPFSSLFTFTKLADFVSFIESELAKIEVTQDVSTGEEEAEIAADSLVYVPITEPQQEIWLGCKMGGEQANRAYTLSYTAVFKGSLDFSAMERAVQHLITRHDSLRGVFDKEGQMMIINSSVKVKLAYKDVNHMTAPEQEQFLEDFDSINRDRPFDLETGPLVRFALIRTAPEEHRFYFYTHHIICDGWSMRVILKELSVMYSSFIDNTDLDIEEAPSFSTYARVLHERSTGPTYAKTLDYWKKLLSPPPPPLNLPLDFARPEKRTYNSRYEVYRVSSSISDGLKKVGKDTNCSLAITLRVAFETFLYRLTNQTDVVVGLPISGQITENLENLVGHTIFLLPVRAQLKAEESFLDNLKNRKAEILQAYDHYSITFGSLIRELEIPRDESRIPLTPIVLNIHMDDLGDYVNFNGLTCSSRGERNNNHETFSGFELSLSIINTEAGLKIEWLYNQDLFDKSTIDSFQERFEHMLNALFADPARPLSEIPLVDQQSLRTTIANWNNNYEPYDKDGTLHQLISECAARFPDQVAVSYQDHRITYRELEEKSNRIARFLIEQGVNVGDSVGVAVDRSITMIATLIAVMKTGAIYLPFETSHPKSRITYILKETSAKYLITSSIYQRGYSQDVPILLIEDIQRESSKLSSDGIQGVAVAGDDLVYILHTSGSTGKPKGVKIRHRNVVNFLKGMLKRPGIQSDDRLLAVTPISFDMAVVMYLPLVCGAEVVLADEESSKDGRLLHQLMVTRAISWMIATPATWQMIIDSGWKTSAQLLAISAGEALSKDLAEKLIARCSSVWNGYGPTETTVMVLMKEVKSIDDPITLGTPINNTSIYIVDKNNQLAAIGQEGEILIGGDGVGAGYHNLPELTTKSFVKNLVFPEEGGILYRTGDLGKYLANGDVLYLGRNDHQVKVRGHRIELGEVEQTLLQIDGIKSAVVKPFGDIPDNATLVGYIIPENEQLAVPDNSSQQTDKHTFSYSQPAETEINMWTAYLADQLPSYMVPREFLYLTEFPLTENGKVDRGKLPAPLRHISTDGQNEANIPISITEIKLANIWKGLLKIENIGIKDNFFHLGGHSLMAVKMMIQVEREIGEQLPISSLIEAPSVRALAQLIDKKSRRINWKSLVPVKIDGNKPPLYVIHGMGLNVLFFQSVVPHLDPEQPVFALQAKGLDGSLLSGQTIEEIAADYIDEIQKHNPNGPYALSGYSYGGIVAVEMAKQLKAMGKDVSFVGLFDTYANTSTKELLGGNNWNVIKFQLNKMLAVPLIFAKYPYHYMKDKYFYAKAHLRHFVRWLLPNNTLFNEPPKYFRRLRDQHMDALKKYSLTSYDGDVTLFRSKEKIIYMPFLDTNGWRPSISGDIHIVEIPGNHAQLFQEPIVGILGKELQKRLDEIHLLKSQSEAILNEQTA